jgi:hypothetical protein
MLQGVQERAEGRPFVPPVLQLAAHVGWALAALVLGECRRMGRAVRAALRAVVRRQVRGLPHIDRLGL